MKKPHPDSPFARLARISDRALWEAECWKLYESADYTVICVGVDKVAHYYRSPRWNKSIYELLVREALVSYCRFLEHLGCGDIVTEATNRFFDDELRKMYSHFFQNGDEVISAASVRNVFTSSEIKIKPKAANIVGLQFADLLASACFTHLRQIYADGFGNDVFSARVAALMERSKFFRDPQTGDPDGFGRVWFPKR